MQIRDERPGDEAAIGEITRAAFAGVPHSSQTEPRIVEALRQAGALTLSLVAVGDQEIVGHIAFSPVLIDGQPGDWYGLGPVSVEPELQAGGIGTALIRAGLDRLRDIGAHGCVLLGDPNYYRRFGFVADPELTYAGGPPEAFQRLGLTGEPAKGEVTYHPAFEVA
jgi:predicted N-acetyltransferase YhbS